MRFRGPLLLINVLIVLGLILADLAIGFPRAALSSQARAAASAPVSEGMSAPALAGKRAKMKRQSHHDGPRATKHDPKKDRTRADSKQANRHPDRKQTSRKPDGRQTVRKQDGQSKDRQRSLQQEAGKPVERGPDDSLASFSNFGADVDIAAPGVGVLSTVPSGGCGLCDPSEFGLSDGTSMAAPHVAGAAAFYLATHPGASPAQVKTALLNKREQVALFNDPDGAKEGVLRVAGGPPVVIPPPPDDASPPKHHKKKHKKGKKGKKGKHNKRKR